MQTNKPAPENYNKGASAPPAAANQNHPAPGLRAQGLSCVKDLEGKWSLVRERHKFKEGVSLGEQMFMFAIPAFEFAQKKYPLLWVDASLSDMLLVMMIGNAVISSSSHPAHEVSEALPVLKNMLQRHFNN